MFLKFFIIGWLVLALTSCDKSQFSPAKPRSDIKQKREELLALSSQGHSVKGKLKFRSSKILRNTYAKVLGLNRIGQCLELGKIPCSDIVHNASLLGMDAYTASQYAPSPTIGVTAPFAVERMAMSACVQRASLDLLSPSTALIFRDITLSGDGRLTRDRNIDQAITRLYKRALQRHPTEEETAGLINLYEEIFKKNNIASGRNWMVLSCFAVLTSTELLFY